MATPNLGLEKIARGDATNWDVEEDANKDIIDTVLGTQHTMTGTHDSIEPAVDSTGSIGTAIKKYAIIYVDAVPTPTIGTHPVTKAYVDGLIQGISWQESVIDNTLTAPPGSPSVNDRYIVAIGGTGVWAGHDNKFAEWNGSTWDLTAPVEPNAVWVITTNILLVYNGTSWIKIGNIIDHTNLQNIGTNSHAQIDTHIANGIDGITPTTTKGDLLVEGASALVRLAIGTNGYKLVADSTQVTGMKWADSYFLSSLIALGAQNGGNIAHGLGGMPKGIQIYLECITAEFGYSIGDRILYNMHGNTAGPITVMMDATNITYSQNTIGGGPSTIAIRDKTTYGPFNLTNANWSWRFTAWT